MRKLNLLALTFSIVNPSQAEINEGHQKKEVFNGWYIGAQIGKASNEGKSDNYSYTQNPNFISASPSTPSTVGGLTIVTYNITYNNVANTITKQHSCKSNTPLIEITGGYNWNFNDWVLGCELAIKKDFMKATHCNKINGQLDDSNEKIKQNFSWKIAGRVGYLISNEILIFGSFGFENKELTNYWVTETNEFKTSKNDTNKKNYMLGGIVIGTGVEKTFEQFSVRCSYNYFVSRESVRAPNSLPYLHNNLNSPTVNSRFNTHEILIGVFYHF